MRSFRHKKQTSKNVADTTIKSEAFCEYSHLQGYITSKNSFEKRYITIKLKKGVKIYYTTKLCHV